MVMDNKDLVPRTGQGKVLPVGPHRVRLVYRAAGAPFSLIEWVAPPAVPGPPLHLHRSTDEAFYVIDGTYGFQLDEGTIEGPPGTFVFIPRGQAHTYWNQGSTPARLLGVISPPGFESYFEELSEGLTAAGESQEKAMEVRQRLSAKHDIEIVGPPQQAKG